MPENGELDRLTRRMTALRDAATDPFDKLSVAVDYLRGAARRGRRGPAGPADAVVLLVATDLWRTATELLTAGGDAA
jgi:hypothetical protein